MTGTTTRFDQKARGDMVASYAAAPTRTVSVGGVDFAYRELGPTTGVPVVFLTHLAAVLDLRLEPAPAHVATAFGATADVA